MNIIDDLKISKSAIAQVLMPAEAMVGMSGNHNVLITIPIQVFCMHAIGTIMISAKELSIAEGAVTLSGQPGYALRFSDKGIGLPVTIEVGKEKVCHKPGVINDRGRPEGAITIIEVNPETGLVGSKKQVFVPVAIHIEAGQGAVKPVRKVNGVLMAKGAILKLREPKQALICTTNNIGAAVAIYI
jgi:hypothetical protein